MQLITFILSAKHYFDQGTFYVEVNKWVYFIDSNMCSSSNHGSSFTHYLGLKNNYSELQ